jgi:hypothetical protein
MPAVLLVVPSMGLNLGPEKEVAQLQWPQSTADLHFALCSPNVSRSISALVYTCLPR